MAPISLAVKFVTYNVDMDRYVRGLELIGKEVILGCTICSLGFRCMCRQKTIKNP